MGKSRTNGWHDSQDPFRMIEAMCRSDGYDPAACRFVAAALLRRLPKLVRDAHEMDELKYLAALGKGLDRPPIRWTDSHWDRFRLWCFRPEQFRHAPGDFYAPDDSDERNDPSEEAAGELVNMVTVDDPNTLFQFLDELCEMFASRGTDEDWDRLQFAAADLLREVFGPPASSRGVAVPVYRWVPRIRSADRTDTVLLLARQMWKANNFSAMPILADALQDAGCDRADVLDHCRSPDQPHCRGCWVLDAILNANAGA